MSNRIVNLRLKNFKCFDNSKYYEFKIDGSKNPVILSGPNGFGKTTFFDAIEIMFSKQITRLEKQIESKRTNLGKNLLLNETGTDGYIVLTLEDDNHSHTTLLGKINKDNHNIDVEKSILYGSLDHFIATEELDSVIASYTGWTTDINTNLRYRQKDFNVYYYISQAESVHFLKRSVQDRKNAMDVLLKTDVIDRKYTMINNLIGARRNASTPINNEIRAVQDSLEALIKEYKLYSNGETELVNNGNVSLGVYEEDRELFYWDNPKIEETDIDNIRAAESIVERLYFYTLNKEDFWNKRKNDELNKLCNNNTLSDYAKCRHYIRNGKLDIKSIKDLVQEIDRKVQIFNYSKFFIEDKPEASSFDEKDIDELKELIPECMHIDFSKISMLSREIVSGEKNLSSNQKILTKLEEARISLKEAKQNYANESSNITRCPYCNTEFKSVEELNDGFNEVSVLLKKEGSDVAQLIFQRKEELYSEIRKVSPIIISAMNGVDESNKDILIKKKANYQMIIADNGKIQEIEKLNEYLEKSDFNPNVKDEDLETEIKRALSNLITSIKNPEFDGLLKEYDFNGLIKIFGEKMSLLTERVTSEKLFQKKNYFAGLINEVNNAKALECKQQIKELIVKKEKLTKIRENLNALGKVYDSKLNEYKRITLEKLRIPLLIYTGKILQDYQNGLGVFIDEDVMRFVSNGDAKHDILNTFSSGQLSGFVMAFLFAMNKQYIKKSNDDLGFILIDDPVQTMDDINIASLIEVMRNDFAKKQIILSTHEVDKENYILYKFFKYNLVGQSFNVKENLYSN